MPKYLKINFLYVVTILLVSCNPKVSSSLSKQIPPLDYMEEVIVLGINDPMPNDGEIIGAVKIGDTGFSTNCGIEYIQFREDGKIFHNSNNDVKYW